MMKEERMFILNMVSDGKVTAQEGELLLKALGASGNCVEKMDGIRTKVMDFAKENEPRMRQMAHTIAEKSADVMDSVSRSIKEKVGSDENKDTMQ